MSQFGWRDLRVLYHGRMNGEESARIVNSRKLDTTSWGPLELATKKEGNNVVVHK
jgi:hypothetical protein